MKLEKQICNKELAKNLKELGVKQESEWIWAIMNIGAGQSAYIYNTVSDKGYHRDAKYSAFTVAELGEMLKKFGQIERFYNVLGKWVIRNALKNKRFEADTEANARAKMLIYLLENKLLNKPKVKED